MSANRIIPYGYAMENGKNIIHPQESKIIRRIYADYLGGASLLRIAQTLTDEKIEFLPGRSDWNKNRVKRILEDERYLGTDTYPAIIGEDMFRKAQAVKDSNNNQTKNQSEVSFHLRCPAECFCGGKMNRRHDSRRKVSQDLWTCQNPDCKRIVNINDGILLGGITAILNRLIADPSLIQTDSITDTDPPLEVRRLQGEVNRQLDGYGPDKESLKEAVFKLAAEKYRNIDPSNIISFMLRAAFEQSEPLSSFSLTLFKQTVRQIQFDENGDSALVLKNNQRIGKEIDHADRNHEHTGDSGITA
ncbi:MAG: recombinase family protein [Eubacteriales bacterium]|nr:recombinase family protein [Eubacteriales bacterium]